MKLQFTGAGAARGVIVVLIPCCWRYPELNVGMELAVRGSQGLYMLSGGPRFNDGEESSGFCRDTSANCKAMSFSDSGLFAWSDGKIVKISTFKDNRWAVSATLEGSGRTTFLNFSPKGSYICTWEVYAKNLEEHNVRIWNAKTGSMIHSYVQRKSDGWCPQWTTDESICCHKNPNNEVIFYKENDFSQPLPQRLSIKGLDSYFMSPQGNARVACYIPGQKGAPGFCKMFVYPNFKPEGDAVATKSFMLADRMEAKWNKADGKSCLILAQAEVDKTGASYYGKTQLCYANVDGDTAMVQLPKEGPIYSVEWAPTKPAQFVVVYGYMPAKATLFNRKCEAVFDFGTGARNMVLFNPMGNLLLLGGFGNLRGNMEIWDVQGKKKAAQFEAPDSTDVKWSPDGQHIMTSTCAPRLRTGNGFKIWHYSSTLFHEMVLVNMKSNSTPNDKQIAAPTCDELWEVCWRPVKDGTFPTSFHIMNRPIAGGLESKTPTASKQAYRPPGARNRTENSAPGQVKEGVYKATKTPVGIALPTNTGEGAMSKSAAKNKGRRGKKKQKEGSDEATPSTNPAPCPAANNTGIFIDDKEKQVKKLQKKLTDIEKLKVRKANGESLEANQLEKIDKEAELIAEMKKLTA